MYRSGFRVQVIGFKGFEFSVKTRLGFGILGSGFRVLDFGFRDSNFGFRVVGCGCRTPGLGFRVLGSDSGFRVSGLGVRPTQELLHEPLVKHPRRLFLFIFLGQVSRLLGILDQVAGLGGRGGKFRISGFGFRVSDSGLGFWVRGSTSSKASSQDARRLPPLCPRFSPAGFEAPWNYPTGSEARREGGGRAWSAARL